MARQRQKCETMNKVICFPFSGASIGGSLVSSLEIIKILREKKDVTVIVAVSSYGNGAEFLEQNGISVKVWSEFCSLDYQGSIYNRMKTIFSGASKAKKKIKEEKIDIVHTNDAVYHLIWSLACKISGRVHIWHQRTKVSGSRAFLIGMFLATKILCISKYVQSALPRHVRFKSYLLVNPIVKRNVMTISQSDEKKTGTKLLSSMPKDKFIVGFIGAFNNQKRIIDFLKIVQKMKNDDDKHFIIVGKEGNFSMFDVKEILIDREINESVTVIPFVNDIYSIYNVLNILVAPAIDEASGRVLLEAMFEGVPVLASKSGGHQEIIKDKENGFLVSPGIIEDYVNVIRSVSDNTNCLKSICLNAKAFVKDEHSLQRFRDNLTMVYDSLLD